MSIRKKVAIIGTGIAGMAAGYLLRNDYEIHFFEKKAVPGGHTNTVEVEDNGKKIAIDTGFMVYNEKTYPNLVRFFKELAIPTKPASMSFSVQHVPLGLEYCGTGISGLFAQRKNIVNLRFWKLLLEINRFNRYAPNIFRDSRHAESTLAEWMKAEKFRGDILEHYLLPMSSAIWSCPSGQMLSFPAATLIRFFKNHGLLGLTTHFEWRTVEGGSRVYRDKVLGLFPGKVWLDNPVVSVVRRKDHVEVKDWLGRKLDYDAVILAAHADESLGVLTDASDIEKRVLSKFRYQKNRVMLHTDASLMPRVRRAWSSWNVRIQKNTEGDLTATTLYYMNSLQGVSKTKHYFVSINDPGLTDPRKILWESEYTHPIFDLESIRAQKDLAQLNTRGKVFFCGSYFRYGFHEDAFCAGVSAAEALAGKPLWNTAVKSGS